MTIRWPPPQIVSQDGDASLPALASHFYANIPATQQMLSATSMLASGTVLMQCIQSIDAASPPTQMLNHGQPATFISHVAIMGFANGTWATASIRGWPM